MANDDEQARKARAEKLRKEIARLRNPKADDRKKSEKEDDADTGSSAHESPREFVHRRMRELNKEKG
jgi:hypothetical protein